MYINLHVTVSCTIPQCFSLPPLPREAAEMFLEDYILLLVIVIFYRALNEQGEMMGKADDGYRPSLRFTAMLEITKRENRS